MRTVRRFAYAFGFLLLLSPCALAERLPIRGYTTEDGLPSDEVYRVRSDSRGFLWFLTREGLARFDGLALTTFGPEHGLPAGFMVDFLETSEGRILVATSEGVYSLTEGPDVSAPRFERIRGEDSDLAVWTEILFEDSAGRVWCGLNIGLFLLEREEDELRLRKVDLSPYQGPHFFHGGAKTVAQSSISLSIWQLRGIAPRVPPAVP